MNSQTYPLILAAIITGAVVPFQAGANAMMGRTLGHPLWGSVVSLLVSIICILPILAMARVEAPTLSNLAQAPKWVWLGGIVGLVYVTGALLLAPRLGAAGFIAAVIFGQMLASVVIDQWGLVGLPQRELSVSRIGGLGIIFVGLLVMQMQSLLPKPASGL